MSATEEHIDRRNDTLTVVDGKTYVVHFTGSYATAHASVSEELQFTLHMNETEARALLAGLQEALA
jgi:hypothetical protein